MVFNYMKRLDDSSSIFLLLYVDDILIATKSMNEVNKLKILLGREFDMKDLGAAKKILGVEICKDRALWRLRLSKSYYAGKVLEMFNMENEKPVSTPLENHFILFITQCPMTDDDVQYMSQVTYASVVGCLMYDMVCTRLILAQAVSMVSKFLLNPGHRIGMQSSGSSDT